MREKRIKERVMEKRSKIRYKIKASKLNFVSVIHGSVVKEDVYTLSCDSNHYMTIVNPMVANMKCRECITPLELQIENARKRIYERVQQFDLDILEPYRNAVTPMHLKCLVCQYEFSIRPNSISYSKSKTLCPCCRGGPGYQQRKIIKAAKEKEKEELEKLSHTDIPINGWIYKSTSPAGKVYIGQTNDLQNRWRRHRRDHTNPSHSSYNTKFYQSLRSLGYSNFTWEILYENIPWNEMDTLEIREINEHDSYHNGLNGTPGGKGFVQSAREAKVKYKREIREKEEQKLRLEDAQRTRELTKFEKCAQKEIKEFLKKAKEPIKKIQTESWAMRRQMKIHNAKMRAAQKIPKSSQYIGVCRDKRHSKWKANIKHKGKKIHLGLFDNEVDAAKTYDAKCRQLRGLKAKTNF